MSSVFKIYSPEDCDFYYDGELQGHIDGNSKRAFRFEVERKGVYRLEFINSEYQTELMMKVSIDADEEREVELDFSEVNEPVIRERERERIILAIEHDYGYGKRLPEEILSAICKDGIVTIPKGVRKIGYSAFSYCENLKYVTIPNSVTEIGHLAFYRCKSLISVDIPDSVTKIGRQAFCNCESLTNVTIPNGVKEIEDSTFYQCWRLRSVIIPDSVTSIKGYAFCQCASLTSVSIPNSITTIGEGAFGKCSSLTSVTIPDSVTSIAPFAFAECRQLTSIYCKATTPPQLGECSFGDRSGLKIYVPKSEGSTVLKAYKSEIIYCSSNGYSAPSWEYYDGIIEEYDFDNE